MRSLLPTLLALACSEYELNPEKEVEKPDDTGLVGDTAPDDSGPVDTADPVEICDGVDNDGDGDIDEDYDDLDQDGTADCVDDDCVADPPDAIEEVDEDCEGGESTGTPPADPWNWQIEWQWLGGAVYSTPSVGDLDLDGTPEVVVNMGGYLYVLDGASGAVEQRLGTGIDSQSGTALGDIDLDGYGDIVTTTGSCYTAHTVVAFKRDGSQLWSRAIGTACETYPVIQDLDADGDVEIVVNEYVLDGATGAVLATLPISSNWGAPAAADMDLDGTMEIMLENGVYSATGTLLWTCGAGGTGTFPQPVNIDADLEAELLVAAPSRMTLCDDDGTVLWQRSHTSYGSAIAVADFDGDGAQEFAFANYGTLALIETNGSARWVTAITDTSGLAGTTSWDIDLDGVPEVIYADEQDILALNGRTGAVVLREPSHGSVTLAETPAVADVDGDGSGELVYGSNSGITGITVVGSADGDWPYAKPVYNQYTYYGGNVNDDLTIPASPDPPWIYSANLFRGQPSAIYVTASPNLQARIADLCVAACLPDGFIEATLQVWNDGGADIDAGETARLYGLVDGSYTLLEETTLPALPSGSSTEWSFSSTVALVGTELLLVVDEDAALTECVEDDNQGNWVELPDCGG